MKCIYSCIVVAVLLFAGCATDSGLRSRLTIIELDGRPPEMITAMSEEMTCVYKDVFDRNPTPTAFVTGDASEEPSTGFFSQLWDMLTSMIDLDGRFTLLKWEMSCIQGADKQ